MVPSPSSPRTSWPKRISRALALILFALSTVTIVGWWLRIEPLLSWSPNAISADPSTVLGFFLFGISLLCIEGNHRFLGMAAAAGAGLLGLSALVEGFFTTASGNAHWSQENPAHLLFAFTRISNAVALCFILAAIPLVWLVSSRMLKLRTLALALAGSLLMSAGFSVLLGPLLNLPAAYRVEGEVIVSQASAIMMLFLGAALILLAWRENQRIRSGAPPWITVPVIVASMTFTLFFWSGLRERERTYLDATTQAALNNFASSLNAEFSRLGSAVERLSRRWSETPELPAGILPVDARALLEEVPACSTVAFIDASLRNRWIHPKTPSNDNLQDFDHTQSPRRRAALQAAQPENSPAAFSANLAGPTAGFAVYSSIYRENQFVGYASVEVPYRRLFDSLEKRLHLSPSWHVSIHLADETLYEAGPDTASPRRHRLESIFNFAGHRFRIEMTPTREGLEHRRHHLPELALGAGIGITLLLALSVHLARAARSSLHSARLSNQRLLAENDERRRIEQQLTLSEERLRLALDATLIGISEWNVPGNELKHSSGLWALLGFKPGEIAPTPGAWTELIHAEDRPAYLATVTRQLAGQVSLSDIEYRVRTGRGSWVWLHSRARTVTSDSSGTPIRILGTIQDITARKESEEALRVSQAAARKLSLVAAHTDNLVIIGRPDGTVEWINESFEHLLEYKLSEVAGRSPVDFMVGPETNPRTLRRIQAAIRRGEAVSTDITCYSKSGRRFHLHLEVQPVRNEAGQVENVIAVLADITARVETEHNLRRAKSEADTASKAKSEFLASMSHEIRTPMNGVIGMTSLLLDTKLDREQRDYVNTIRTSGEALLTIINDILDFSKIESGKMEFERLPFELSVCLEDVLDLLSVAAASKKLDLAYHIEDDVPSWILSDVTRLRQILVNLVNNAVKFTPAGTVSLTVRRLPLALSEINPGALTLEFSVTDTGVGIPPDRLNRLFRPFSQVDSSTTRKFGGTGLGLAICHRLCTLMGGDFRVTSTVRAGSTFSFTLPTEAVPVPPGWSIPEMPAGLNYGPVLCVDENPVSLRRLQSFLQSWGARATCSEDPEQTLQALDGEVRPVAAVADLKTLLRESFEGCRRKLIASDIPLLLLTPQGSAPNQLESFTGRIATTTATKPLRTPSLIRGLQSLFGATPNSISPFPNSAAEPLLAHDIPLNILLAEDNPVNQKVALRYLERLGYRADCVSNGLEALNTLEARDYELVLMDLQMPEMDGLEASRQIRQRLPAHRQPKIIALTANALQGDRELCLAAGMDDYISKPVKLHEVAEVIRRLFPKS